LEDKILKRNIESAGGWFVGEYAAMIIDNYDCLSSDKKYKNEFIKHIFNSQGRDKDYSGTRVRVNALLRVFKSNKIIEALNYIVTSYKINKDDPKAVEMAKEALESIKPK